MEIQSTLPILEMVRQEPNICEAEPLQPDQRVGHLTLGTTGREIATNDDDPARNMTRPPGRILERGSECLVKGHQPRGEGQITSQPRVRQPGSDSALPERQPLPEAKRTPGQPLQPLQRNAHPEAAGARVEVRNPGAPSRLEHRSGQETNRASKIKRLAAFGQFPLALSLIIKAQ